MEEIKKGGSGKGKKIGVKIRDKKKEPLEIITTF